LLAPGKLLLTLAGFELTRRNIADCDPLYLDCSREVDIGEQRIRGAEAELAGKPFDWIDMIATYAYLDGKVTRNDPSINGIAVGSRLPEATPHSASVLAKFALAPLGLRDFALSAGIYYVSSRPGRNYFDGPSGEDLSRPLLVLPASTRLDLGAFWEVSKTLRLQANLTNVFNVEVYEPANYGFSFIENRRFTLGASATF
jgi:iron complex outermembrane recepter protein